MNLDSRQGSGEALGLAEALLRSPSPDDSTERPGAAIAARSWTPYSTLSAALLSLFIAYHSVAVALYALPSIPALRTVYAALDRPLGITPYMAVNGNPRGWGLFAPNANQANYFAKVLIEDPAGRQRDLQVDTYGRRPVPYLFYDRRANLNRRVAQGETALRPFYAAWACRTWERGHGGEPARAAILVRLWTRIPPPETAYATMGYHPMGLYPNEDQQTRYDCATTPGGRLPNDQRRRAGLPARTDAPTSAPLSAPSSAEEPAETSKDGY